LLIVLSGELSQAVTDAKRDAKIGGLLARLSTRAGIRLSGFCRTSGSSLAWWLLSPQRPFGSF